MFGVAYLFRSWLFWYCVWCVLVVVGLFVTYQIGVSLFVMLLVVGFVCVVYFVDRFYLLAHLCVVCLMRLFGFVSVSSFGGCFALLGGFVVLLCFGWF